MNYIPPAITGELGRSADAAGDRNILARGARGEFASHIDGVAVADLIAQHGSPLFVFSERAIREKVRRAREAFHAVYPETTFAWSYKTNYIAAICNIMHQEGSIAEVVSDFEYRKATKRGIPGPDIIYNGPDKPADSLRRAMVAGSIVQIDNWDELGLVEAIATEFNRPARVGIRTWFDTGFAPVWSKFGFSLANGEARRAGERILSNPKLRLETLHTHIGTYILAPEAYAVAADRLLALRDTLFAESGYLVPAINLGGGFPSYSLLHGMVGPAALAVPPIESYAAAIARVLSALPRQRQPRLILESGRHLIDEAGYLLASVVAIKGAERYTARNFEASAAKARLMLGEHTRGGYVVDAGVNFLYTATWYSIGVLPTRPSNMQPQPIRLYGNLCMNIDVIRESVDLPPLEVGDTVLMHPVGAYNVTQWMQFIAYRPAVVLVGMDGKVDVIRQRETLSDIDQAELVPERLDKSCPANS